MPTHCAPIAAMSRSHPPPPRVKTIAGTRSRNDSTMARIGASENLRYASAVRSPPHVSNNITDVGAAFDLRVEIRDDRAYVDVDDARQEIRSRVRHLAHEGEVAAAAALDHVARERERASRESDEGNTAAELALDLRDRLRRRSRAIACRARERSDRASSRSGRAKRGPSPSANESPRPIASGIVRMSEKENRGVERKARERLQRDFGGVIGILRERHEAACLRAHRVVLGEVASGLPHEPDRRVRRRLAPQRAQKVSFVITAQEPAFFR
jgi:hypothetical protein